MIGYIIRRILYAIPIIIGVNVIVFAIFFFVSSPDDVARQHIGHKRATPEKIDAWKREKGLDQPYFYNAGWKQFYSLSAMPPEPPAEGEKSAKRPELPETKGETALPAPGDYALVIDAALSDKEVQQRIIKLESSLPDRLVLPKEFSKDGSVTLQPSTERRRFTFEVTPGEPMPKLSLTFAMKSPSPVNRVAVEYKAPVNFSSHFTDTIFFVHSVKPMFLIFGKSWDGKDISDEVWRRIGPSLTITVPVFFMALLIDLFFGMLSAYYRGTYLDYWGVIVCVLMMSISFMFYIMGVQAAAGKYLRLAPVSGYDYGLDSVKFIVLPIFVAIIGNMGGGIRFNRTIFLEEVNRDYVRTARAKGLPESKVLFIHALKNSMLPILTSAVTSLPFLIMGGLLLESFFGIPGMGAYTLDGIQAQDFAVTQAMVMLSSYLYVVALTLTDISYTLVDPRIALR